MARFSGLVGFAHSELIRPGVTQDVITEKGPYFGDVKRASLSMLQTNVVNAELRTTNTIEIIAADEYVSENFFAIRFVVWAGAAWSVTEVTLERPRLHLRLGGVYRGARAKPAEAAEAPGSP